MSVWDQFSDLAQRLLTALQRWEPQLGLLHVSPLTELEWFELLRRKVIPQLGQQTFLVAAVTGGTNIGKSVVFNHLAGFRVSASSPLASGTRHPVCLIPPGFAETHNLHELFRDFDLRVWTDAEQPLEDSPEHRLFWRVCPELPANLLILDTPDIDSDAPVNWQRADAIRQSADVLIAVLTQQKYNDAAIKQFFRKAAAEGKSVVVVFNLCDLPEDEPHWPLWLETFAAETSVQPLSVYLAPTDRKAAEELRLPFWPRPWPLPVASSTAKPAAGAASAPPPLPLAESPSPPPLQEVFAKLEYERIKLQALRGSLATVCDEQQGLPAYLREIALRSNQFQRAAEALSTWKLAEIPHWPNPPLHLVIQAVRNWWSAHREGFTAKIQSFYDSLNQSVWIPWNYMRNWLTLPEESPWEAYRRQEWETILYEVQKIYDTLERISDFGNELLQQQVETILRGSSREALLERMEAEHRSLDFAAELSATVSTELQAFREENPQLFRLLRRIDDAAVAARPVLTVMLGMTGLGSPLSLGGDLAFAAIAVTVGDTMLSTATSQSMGYVQAKFHRLQVAFITRRARWLAQYLESSLGVLIHDIPQAAHITRSPEFQELRALAAQWKELLGMIPDPRRPAAAG